MDVARQQQDELAQQQQQQQQQLDPRLLESLPAPALRLVLQLASTSRSPALCRLCCVSKGMRAAAEAAAPPSTNVQLSYRHFHYNMWSFDAKFAALAAVTTYHASLQVWLPRYAHHIYKLTVVHGDVSLVDLPSLFTAMASSTAALSPAQGPAAAGTTAPTSRSMAAGAGCGGGEAAATGTAASRCPLQCLHLRRMWLSPALLQAMVNFGQLQVLTVVQRSNPDIPMAPQLLQALSQLKQLRKLALRMRLDKGQPVAGGALLQALPPGLRALDLRVRSRSCSSSSLVHLVHLTSLKLQGMGLVRGAATQQQQQGEGQAAFAPTALYMQLEGARSWCAVPSVTAMELHFRSSPGTTGLAQLAACPHLRQLAVYQPYPALDGQGASALTQLTWLRMGRARPPKSTAASSSTTISSSSSVGADLKPLWQLRVLEVNYSVFAAAQRPTWLSQLHNLEQLVVFGMGKECQDLSSMERLAEVLEEWHSSTSTGGQRGGLQVAVAQGRVDGGSRACAKVARSVWTQCRLQCVQLTLSLHDTDTGYSMKWGRVQQAAADMAAALPWLQVVAREHTSYTCPC